MALWRWQEEEKGRRQEEREEKEEEKVIDTRAAVAAVAADAAIAAEHSSSPFSPFLFSACSLMMAACTLTISLAILLFLLSFPPPFLSLSLSPPPTHSLSRPLSSLFVSFQDFVFVFSHSCLVVTACAFDCLQVSEQASVLCSFVSLLLLGSFHRQTCTCTWCLCIHTPFSRVPPLVGALPVLCLHWCSCFASEISDHHKRKKEKRKKKEKKKKEKKKKKKRKKKRKVKLREGKGG